MKPFPLSRMDIQVLALTLIILSGGAVASVWIKTHATYERHYAIENDPQTGQSINLPETDIFGRSVPHDGKLLVFAAGACSSCSLHSVNPEKLDLHGFSAAIFLYRAHRPALLATFPHQIKQVYITTDPDGAFSSQLNDEWSPRASVIEDGKLIDLGKNPYGLPDYVKVTQ